MTALNGIVQGDAVHLLTDGAGYSADGTIQDIGTKVLILSECRLAIGWAGYNPMGDIGQGIRKRRLSAAPDIMAALPTILRESVAAQERRVGQHKRFPILNRIRGYEPGQASLSVLVAMWDNGPQLWAIYSDNTFLPPPYEPFTPIRLARYLDGIEPGTEPEIFGREVRFEDPASFDAASDGLTLLEHQRRTPWENGHYAVGGFADLTTVSVDGVQRQTLKWWPDTIGERINPELEAA